MSKKLTPMMEQYTEIKSKYSDELLFFRLGDFYELFFEDALTASKELNITLTGRAAGLEDKAPMCGVPFHAAESYILKLVQKGYKVAICEQMEDPALAKGIVKRDVIRVITPGTVMSENGTEEGKNNFLTVFRSSADGLVMLFADVSTGEVIWSLVDANTSSATITNSLMMYRPTEIIVSGNTSIPEEVHNFVTNTMEATIFSAYNEDGFDDSALLQLGNIQFNGRLQSSAGVLMALGALLAYLENIIKVPFTHLTNIHHLSEDNRMVLDASCLRHLEITRNSRDGGVKGTLLAVLDKTETPMGARLLKQWIESPLLEAHQIEYRQLGIGELINTLSLRSETGELLQSVFDFERILTRVETGSVSPRDLLALRESLRILPQLKEVLKAARTPVLKDIHERINEHHELLELLEKAIADMPALTLKDGKVIRDGYSAELDELRSLAGNSQAWLQRLEDDIREKTGIRLKTGYNKVFGYYFEVSHAHTTSVPDYFIRKQTLTNAERYITPELKEFEIKMLSAKDKIIALEQSLFQDLRKAVQATISEVQLTARAVAEFDVYRSLAVVAYQGRYIRPAINQSGQINIKDGRHPVIEKYLKQEVYVPNDTLLNHDENEFLLITGPNMAGKSTYMRQVAILMIMAQIGSFIPASEAAISPVDRIFTRVGASDDIATGQSTFMVEMKEVSYILENATKDSLIILDEIGRGTSTFDGLSIARAVVEYIVKNIKAKSLFATHYHELIGMENEYAHIKNYTVAVKEKGRNVAFLRRIIRGGADKSYGIHVAKLAGLPSSVLKRAEEILTELETGRSESPSLQLPSTEVSPAVSKKADTSFGNLFLGSIVEQIKTIDILSMTPIEALNLLHKLQEEARKGDGI